jgi:hypothetical protein
MGFKAHAINVPHKYSFTSSQQYGLVVFRAIPVVGGEQHIARLEGQSFIGGMP